MKRLTMDSGAIARRFWTLAVLVSVGCSGSVRSRSVSSPVFRAAASDRDRGAGHVGAWRSGAVPDAAELVERNLKSRGLRFGTDGSVGALYAYITTRHRLVPAAQAQVGDVVFFDLDGGGQACANHVGVVEATDLEGRIVFRESRGGTIRQSYIFPKDPVARRDASGAVLNTFLRPKRINDSDDVRYFAGEMLCAVGRISGH